MIRRTQTLAALILFGSAGLAVGGCHKEEAAAPAPHVTAAPTAVAGAGNMLGRLAPTSDAHEVAKRIVSAFKAVDGMQIATSSDQFMQVGRPMASHQESVTTYRKQPARFSRVTVDQVSGSFKSVADGNNLITYSGLTNTFTRRECRGELAEICRTVNGDTPQLLTAATYLMSSETPIGLQDFKLSGKEQVNGKPSVILQANCTRDLMTGLARQLGLPAGMTPKSGRVAIWVDTESYLPIRDRIELIWTGTPPAAKKPQTFVIGVNEKTTKITPNPQVKDDEFKFAAPANAKEVFTSKQQTASLGP